MDKRPTVLKDQARVVGWISELTNTDAEVVLSRLQEEYRQPGTNVSRALKEFGLEPFIWCDDMGRFYGETDSFLYELVIWNLNELKAWMRFAVARYVDKAGDSSQRVLNIGDGLGIDTVHLAELGHDAHYFELPGYTQRFAQKVFEHTGAPVTVFTESEEVPRGTYDAVVCLDVLEHVPDPPSFVDELVSYLRPGGRLICHESFLWVHPSNPTHLASVRKYSGDLSLYTDRGLRVVDGEIAWNPIVLVKDGEGVHVDSAGFFKQLMLRIGGLYMAMGRFSVLPFAWGDWLRQRRGRWFDPVA